jgi:hypothetical protein
LAKELSVALCAIVKDEADYIEEWLAFHILQGVSRVVIFDNHSSDDTCRRAKTFAKHIDVEIVSWPDSKDGFDLTQRLAYFEGACRLAGVVDFAAFVDVDEFVFASDYRPLGQVLAGFPEEVGAIAINQRVFGSSGLRSSDGGLVTSRFTMAAATDHPEAHWFKTIARPQRIVGFDTVHSVVLTWSAYVLADGTPLPPRNKHQGYSSLVPEGALRLHHYILKSREEFELKRKKWVGQDLSARYTDEYFAQRDRSTNAAVDDRLKALAPRILEIIASARAGAR